MGLNLAELMEDADGGSQNTNSVATGSFLDNFVLMPQGEGFVTVRILPPGNDLPMMAGGLCMFTRVHSINGRKVHCPREKSRGRNGKTYFNGDCRICDHYNWLYRQADEAKARAEEAKTSADAAKKRGEDASVYEARYHEAKAKQAGFVREARDIKPVERIYLNAIVRKIVKDGVTTTNVGPKILSIGKTLWEQIRAAILGDEKFGRAALGDVTHPTTGRDFTIVKEIKKSEEGDFPNYDKSYFSEPSALGNPDQVKEWMANLHDLAALRVLKTSEEIEAEVREYVTGESPRKVPTYDPSMLTNEHSVPAEGSVPPLDPVSVNDEVSTIIPVEFSSIASRPSWMSNAEPVNSTSTGTTEPFNEIESDPVPNVAMDNDAFFATLQNM